MPPKRKSARTASIINDADVIKKAKTGLQVGDSIRDLDIILKDQDDQDVKVSELSNAIVFAYPKASTPGCTTQACGFRDMFEEIQNAGYQVYGLSRDNTNAQKNFVAKQNLPYKLLSDPDGLLVTALGADSFGNKVTRSHWIIDAGGKLEVVEIKVTPKNSFTQTVEFVKNKAGGQKMDVDVSEMGEGEPLKDELVMELKDSKIDDETSILTNILPVHSAVKQLDFAEPLPKQSDGLEGLETNKTTEFVQIQKVQEELGSSAHVEMPPAVAQSNGNNIEKEVFQPLEATKEAIVKPSEELKIEEPLVADNIGS
ncbi:Peroxiredoxin [Neolecta irregularis DAH-3]|uniref:thioredoxin-dependent peroxiredoxin n=1 Tax=Neolecta irregularis (strain DAH-3) TaxID=1198029 RepID=A0A1U7LVZ8_NEOID|nr:Peroxiredoxin [Neolecta irregularis DAH-3]|eukprot:OLL26722.1 Peroxiredoxin [Neolecta irregularis DAH-3]